MQRNILLEAARDLLLEQAVPTGPEKVSLLRANGRILAQKIVSEQQVPPFNRSPLDGYAVRAADTKGANAAAPAILTVVEEIRAGFVAVKQVGEGMAIKLMTGAPIPAGADAVIKFEDITRVKDKIFIAEELQPHSNIVPAGEDVQIGDPIGQRGESVTAPLIGLFAAVGLDSVLAYRPVRVALISTGDELVEPGCSLAKGKIYNSNLHCLGARCLEIGAEPQYKGIADDDLGAIVSLLETAASEADLVITTGGVSVGDFDLVPKALETVGATTLFHRIRIKPGSPMIAAKKDQTLFIGLSGNPAAAFITFELIVVPLIKKMMGQHAFMLPSIEATLLNSFSKASNQRRFLRGMLQRDRDGNQIMLAESQSNGTMKSMIGCDVLVDVPAGSEPLASGQTVKAWLI